MNEPAKHTVLAAACSKVRNGIRLTQDESQMLAQSAEVEMCQKNLKTEVTDEDTTTKETNAEKTAAEKTIAEETTKHRAEADATPNDLAMQRFHDQRMEMIIEEREAGQGKQIEDISQKGKGKSVKGSSKNRLVDRDEDNGTKKTTSSQGSSKKAKSRKIKRDTAGKKTTAKAPDPIILAGKSREQRAWEREGRKAIAAAAAETNTNT